MPGMFQELQRDRVESRVLEIENELDDIMMKLKVNQSSVPPESRQLDWVWSRRLGRFRLEVRKVEEEARTSREYLHKIIKHIEVQTTSGIWLEGKHLGRGQGGEGFC